MTTTDIIAVLLSAASTIKFLSIFTDPECIDPESRALGYARTTLAEIDAALHELCEQRDKEGS